MAFLYYTALSIYVFVLRLLALLGHTKARRWVQGRRHWTSTLATWVAQDDRPIIWMHCSSFGEFEQGRPLLEALNQETAPRRVLLSFFSPSGYEPLQNTPLADHVVYLPADTPGQARRFLDLVQPATAFFVKYDFWYGYLNGLQHRHVPTYLVGAAFRPQQVFFRWYGGFFKRMLFCFTQIFVQNKASLKLLTSVDYAHAVLAGDPRLDRVLSERAAARSFPIVEAFTAGRVTLVAGSTWPQDEALLPPLLQALPNLALVLAPHEINEAHLQTIEQTFSDWPTQRYTNWDHDQPNTTARVLIVDTMGMLRALYRYGNVAYIGGGLSAGLHNSLEAAVYGLPLTYGPNYHKFQEAIDFVQLGIATEIQTADDVVQAVQQALTPTNQALVKAQIEAYITRNQGATQRILNHLTTRPPTI